MRIIHRSVTVVMVKSTSSIQSISEHPQNIPRTFPPMSKLLYASSRPDHRHTQPLYSKQQRDHQRYSHTSRHSNQEKPPEPPKPLCAALKWPRLERASGTSGELAMLSIMASGTSSQYNIYPVPLLEEASERAFCTLLSVVKAVCWRFVFLRVSGCEG